MIQYCGVDADNFEHLTQASTGATTGDWFIKFYAPWCGHCKTLAPVWEDVAKELEGKVNVAKVDVMANRALGTRFEIQGFPTLKLLSKGQVYSYKGRRSKSDLVEFATGGFMISEPSVVPGEIGWFGEITQVYKHAYKQASKDLRNGSYFTADVILAIMPALFVVVLVLICLIPTPDPRRHLDSQPAIIPNRPISASQNANAAPPTASEDTSKKTD